MGCLILPTFFRKKFDMYLSATCIAEMRVLHLEIMIDGLSIYLTNYLLNIFDILVSYFRGRNIWMIRWNFCLFWVLPCTKSLPIPTHQMWNHRWHWDQTLFFHWIAPNIRWFVDYSVVQYYAPSLSVMKQLCPWFLSSRE